MTLLRYPSASSTIFTDAHEWINEIYAVPRCWLVNQPPMERAWVFQRGKKALLSLTLV